MTQYLDKGPFSSPANSRAYVDNYERTFGTSAKDRLEQVRAMLPALEENRATKSVARKLRSIIDG